MPRVDNDNSTMDAHKYLAALSQDEAFQAMNDHLAMNALRKFAKDNDVYTSIHFNPFPGDDGNVHEGWDLILIWWGAPACEYNDTDPALAILKGMKDEQDNSC